MSEQDTHYGDEDPEFEEPDDEDLFRMAKRRGWKPEDMQDKDFAERYKVWLKSQAT